MPPLAGPAADSPPGGLWQRPVRGFTRHRPGEERGGNENLTRRSVVAVIKPLLSEPIFCLRMLALRISEAMPYGSGSAMFIEYLTLCKRLNSSPGKCIYIRRGFSKDCCLVIVSFERLL